MKLIVGLGNPGKKYQNTRHNIGFIIVDEFAKSLGITKYDNKFNGYFVKTKYEGEDIIILKPQTYMNLSGECVAAFAKYFKVEIADILVVYDDLDLATGRIRLRGKSSSGGHNGIKSIEQHLHTNEFKRLKFGISRSNAIDVVSYVIGKFTQAEIEVILPKVKTAVIAIKSFIKEDFNLVMCKFNKR